MQMENCKSLNELCFCTAYIYTKSGNWFFVVFKALRLIFVKLDIFYSERLELWRRAFQCFAHKQTESSNKFYYNVGMAEKYVHTLSQIPNKIIFSNYSIQYSLLSFNFLKQKRNLYFRYQNYIFHVFCKDSSSKVLRFISRNFVVLLFIYRR